MQPAACFAVVFASVIMMVAAGCKSNCVPGSEESCSCSDGSRGSQVCASSGEHFGRCVCTTGPGDGGRPPLGELREGFEDTVCRASASCPADDITVTCESYAYNLWTDGHGTPPRPCSWASQDGVGVTCVGGFDPLDCPNAPCALRVACPGSTAPDPEAIGDTTRDLVGPLVVDEGPGECAAAAECPSQGTTIRCQSSDYNDSLGVSEDCRALSRDGFGVACSGAVSGIVGSPGYVADFCESATATGSPETSRSLGTDIGERRSGESAATCEASAYCPTSDAVVRCRSTASGSRPCSWEAQDAVGVACYGRVTGQEIETWDYVFCE